MMDFISTHAGMIGLLFFFLFFISVTTWTLRPGAKKAYQGHANIPLEEDE